MTIVCATRFTEESSNAVQVAAELARRHKEKLFLVHCLPNTVVPSWGEKMSTATGHALDAEAKELVRTGVNVDTVVLHGKLEHALARFCREKQAGLLVVGDTVQRVGAVSAGTLDRLAGAVESALLVVRDPRPFAAWAKGTAPLRVMLALDHSSSSAVARDWISRLSEYGPIDLVAAHVWWPLEEYDRRRMPPPPPEEGHMALTRFMTAETEAALAALPKNVKRRVHLEMGTGRVADQLLELANDEQVDLFVFGTHRRRALGRLWSVSHHALGNAPMSVACIPGGVPVPEGSRIPSFATAIAATDLSESGNKAITTAIGLVGAGTVFAVHVSLEPCSPEQEAVLLKKLAAVLPPAAEHGAAKVIVHVRTGPVADELIAAADELGADVLCLGVQATTASKNPLVHQLLSRSERPVLLTPSRER